MIPKICIPLVDGSFQTKTLSYVFTLTEDLGLVKLHLFLLKGYIPIKYHLVP